MAANAWFDECPAYPSAPTPDDIAAIQRQALRVYKDLWNQATTTNHQLRIYPERLRDWHKAMFSTVWSEGAGQFRDKTRPTKRYTLQVDDNGALRELRRSGAQGGRRVERRVERICAGFAKAAGERPFVCSLDLEGRVNLASYVLVEVFRVQPFMYGNFSVAWTALNTAYKRMSLHQIFPFSADDAFGRAFAVALRTTRAEDREELNSVLLAGDGTTPLSIAAPIKKPHGTGLMHPSSPSEGELRPPSEPS